MRAWQFDAPGGLTNMHLRDVDVPTQEPGDALVRVKFAGLNPADHYLIKGQYPRAAAPPFTVGREAYGIVEKPAPGGTFQAGDAVIILGGDTGIQRSGTLAEFTAVPEGRLAPAPTSWTPQECAGGAVGHLTAWLALVSRGELQEGQTVLVTGASGGVGSAAVALAKGLGARVFALSRSEEKRRRLTELGADAVFDASDPNVSKQIKGALDGGQIDLVIENLGGPWLETCVRLVAPSGRIMVIGLLAGLTSELTVGLLIHKQVRIEGLTVGSYTPELAQSEWPKIVATLERVGARPLVDTVYPFERTIEAFEHLDRGPMGKIIIETGA